MLSFKSSNAFCSVLHHDHLPFVVIRSLNGFVFSARFGINLPNMLLTSDMFDGGLSCTNASIFLSSILTPCSLNW